MQKELKLQGHLEIWKVKLIGKKLMGEDYRKELRIYLTLLKMLYGG